MVISRGGSNFLFRECDVQELSQEEVQQAADENGYIEYEPHFAWLVIPGIGYGMRTE